MVFLWLFFFGLGGIVLTAVMGAAHFGHHAANTGRAPMPHPVAHLPTVHGHIHTTHSPSAPIHSHGVFARILGRRAMASAAKKMDVVNTHGAAAAASHHSPAHFHLVNLLPSPVDIFSLAFGAGAAGMLATGHVPPAALLPIAAVSAVLFDFVIVRPSFALMLQFASQPSLGLEGSIAFPAEAVTKFDEKGQGLVRIKMDGELIQILARLSPDEIAGGVIVHKGDEVVVTEVDTSRNICQVTRQLSL